MKANLAGRMRAAVDIVRSSTDELQRRYMAQEREARRSGTSSEETAAFRRRAFVAESELIKLRKQMEDERAMRFAGIEERPACPPFPIQRMETGPQRP